MKPENGAVADVPAASGSRISEPSVPPLLRAACVGRERETSLQPWGRCQAVRIFHIPLGSCEITHFPAYLLHQTRPPARLSLTLCCPKLLRRLRRSARAGIFFSFYGTGRPFARRLCPARGKGKATNYVGLFPKITQTNCKVARLRK